MLESSTNPLTKASLFFARTRVPEDCKTRNSVSSKAFILYDQYTHNIALLTSVFSFIK